MIVRVYEAIILQPPVHNSGVDKGRVFHLGPFENWDFGASVEVERGPFPSNLKLL